MGAAPHLRLQGHWTAAALASSAQWHQLQADLARWPTPSAPHWDLSGLGALDHSGAQVLWSHWGGQWPTQLTTTPAQRTLLERGLLEARQAIESREAAEQALRLTQFSIDQSTVGILWVNWDSHSGYANRAAEPMLG